MRYIKRKATVLNGWPPNSPDLSPIENLWAIMKERLNRLTKKPRNKNELKKFIQNFIVFINSNANGDIDYMDYCMNSEVNIRLYTNENSFKLFHKAVFDEINVILIILKMVSKCLGDLIKEEYDIYFPVIEEACLLLQHVF